jgi:hypothetical protein
LGGSLGGVGGGRGGWEIPNLGTPKNLTFDPLFDPLFDPFFYPPWTPKKTYILPHPPFYFLYPPFLIPFFWVGYIYIP